MITDKKTLKEYLEADKANLGIQRRYPPIGGGGVVWKFQVSLRMFEYYLNTTSKKNIGKKFLKLFWYYIYHHYKIKLGFEIPPNTCGKGLNIHHTGCIVINANARIGENCNLQQCVNIGQSYGEENVPVIGNNVYIGPGAKLFGKIEIADDIAIGAGAIVTKSFLTSGIAIAGNPAHQIGVRREGLK